jgi:archaellum component FlaC
MALDFNKINRAAAFNPTTAFPLDARAYFESYENAVLAALMAKEAGDTTTVYYYGQTFVVVENNVAKLYIVQPDNTLKEAGGRIVVDENAFTFDENGVLWLEGFVDAEKGAQLVKGSDGKLSWVVPDTNTIEGLDTTVKALKTDVINLANTVGSPSSETAEASGLFKDLEAKANAADVYTKEETNTAISAAVSNAAHLKRKIVENEAAILDYANSHNDADQYIFMVPTGLQYDANKYYEYIVLKTVDTETEAVSYSVEKIGSWDIDLTDYAKKSDIVVKTIDNSTFSVDESGKLILNNLEITQINGLQDSLNSKVEAQEGFGLVSLSEIEKLASISENAEENFIKEVDTANFTVENGKLILNDLNIVNIVGLDDLLNNESTGLIPRLELVENSVSTNTSNIETILNTLNGDEGLTTVVNGLNEQVSSIKETIQTHTTTINGLNEQVSSVVSSLETLNSQVSTNTESISTLRDNVDDIQLVIQGLDDNYVTKTTYLTEIGNFSSMTHAVAEDSTLIDEVNNLIDAMTWKDIPNIEE